MSKKTRQKKTFMATLRPWTMILLAGGGAWIGLFVTPLSPIGPVAGAIIGALVGHRLINKGWPNKFTGSK
jgi:hypothetical protein